MLLTTLKSGYNSELSYQSLISGHELINLDTVQNLTAQIERRESLEAIQRLFDSRQFDEVIYSKYLWQGSIVYSRNLMKPF